MRKRGDEFLLEGDHFLEINGSKNSELFLTGSLIIQ